MLKWLLISAVLIVLLTGFAIGQSQESDSSELNTTRPYYANGGFEDIEHTISNEEASSANKIIPVPSSNIQIYLSLGVLAFGLILVMFTGHVASKKSSGWDQDATKIFAVSVIVTAGLFLITAGYSDQQIAPMFALLGTIVGYLLGKSPGGEQGQKLS